METKPIEDKEEIIEDIEDKEEYQFTTNVSRLLSQLLEIPEFIYDKNFIWNPPEKYGLTNCEYIIPTYYNNTVTNLFDMDYYEMINDDIRNYRKLNKYQVNYIKSLDHDRKNKIIEALHVCINSLYDSIK